MPDKSAIEWTDATWNPVTGCSKVSPGCAHCYAETLTRRFASTWDIPDLPWTPANAERNVILHPERLEQPLRWQRPRMVFVNSMSDLFHEQVPFDFIAEVFDVMDRASRHTFQILTKRPERIFDFFESEKAGEGWYGFPDNVWVGVSIENRRFVHRADLLRDVPATVRFISAEPLIGPLINELGFPERDGHAWRWEDGYVGPSLDLTGIEWLIVGGESGPGHRPIDPRWVEQLRDEALLNRCDRCGGSGRASTGPERPCWHCHGRGRQTAFFFKQWGGTTPKAGGRELDGRTWDEMPLREPVAA